MSRNFKRRGDHDSDSPDPTLLSRAEFIDAVTEDEIPLDRLDEFIIPGSDEKGRKVTISFNIPPAMDRHIEIILGGRRFPYVNKKDLIRHALVRHLGWITTIRGSIPRHYLSMFSAIDALVKDDEAATKMEQIFNSLHDNVNHHLQRGETGEVIRLCSHINEHIRQMPPSVWVTRFSERFYQRYGAVLRGIVATTEVTVTAQITDGKEEEDDDERPY